MDFTPHKARMLGRATPPGLPMVAFFIFLLLLINFSFQQLNDDLSILKNY